MREYRVRIWRCTKCDKWSHAKERPRKHKRWVQPDEPEYSWDLDETAGDPAVPPGHFVDCGPFAAWVAEYEWHYNRYSRPVA